MGSGYIVLPSVDIGKAERAETGCESLVVCFATTSFVKEGPGLDEASRMAVLAFLFLSKPFSLVGLVFRVIDCSGSAIDGPYFLDAGAY